MTKKEMLAKHPEPIAIDAVNYTGLKIHEYFHELEFMVFGTDIDGKPFKRTLYADAEGWDYFMFYGKRQYTRDFIRLNIGA